MRNNVTFCFLLGLILMLSAQSHAGSPPGKVALSDAPNDAGTKVEIRWELESPLVSIDILRAESPDGEFRSILKQPLPGDARSYTDNRVKPNTDYYYIISGKTTDGGTVRSETAGPVRATGEWFHKGRFWVLIGLVLFSAIMLISLDRAHPDMKLRKIPGIEAVDEAIGRSTEMGKPVLYVLGLSGASSLTTIASMNILGQVARKCAEYETRLLVPCYDPVVMNIVKEIVSNAYSEVGRPDRYRDEDVFFLSDMQFAYAAAIDGIMTRERPGAVFLQGYFYAESLILAETANSIGAIQIAGTTSDAQLPFFIAACDYTLIGEEMFAASAYLSKATKLIGTVRGQDICKAILVGVLIVGVILEMAGVNWFTEIFDIIKTR